MMNWNVSGRKQSWLPHSPGETKDNHGNLSQHSQCPDRESNREPPEYVSSSSA
jgi:hypothetical protein